MINYSYIEDMLFDFRPLTRNINQEGKILSINTCHVGSIVKDKYLDHVKGIFAGNGLDIHYDKRNEVINVKIPE